MTNFPSSNRLVVADVWAIYVIVKAGFLPNNVLNKDLKPRGQFRNVHVSRFAGTASESALVRAVSSLLAQALSHVGE